LSRALVVFLNENRYFLKNMRSRRTRHHRQGHDAPVRTRMRLVVVLTVLFGRRLRLSRRGAEFYETPQTITLIVGAAGGRWIRSSGEPGARHLGRPIAGNPRLAFRTCQQPAAWRPPLHVSSRSTRLNSIALISARHAACQLTSRSGARLRSQLPLVGEF